MRRTAALFLCFACACSADGGMPPPSVPPPEGAWTVAVLPDTQYYACGYPEIFERQAQWIAAHRKERGIGLVLHTGDVVDMNLPEQWQVARRSMQHLRGVVPYLIAPGNHDLVSGRASLFPNYFEPGELSAYDWEAGSYEPERLDNSFAVIEIAGRSWLFLGLEFGPRDAVVQWAAEVLTAHSDLPAVLFTHAYLYSDGLRYDRTREPSQAYHPDAYLFTPEQGINDGEDLWRKLVVPHANVRLVLSGHVIPIGTVRASPLRPSGSRVHEVLANYQTCGVCPCAEVMGGGGYLRLLEFEPEATRIRVSTYSPYLDAWLRDDENEFVLDL
jgi:hypothetical protein